MFSYHIVKHKHCIAIYKNSVLFSVEADLALNNVTILTNAIYREHFQRLTATVKLVHTSGRSFPPVNGTRQNLNITAYMSRDSCIINGTVCVHDNIPLTAADEYQQQGVAVTDSNVFNVTLLVNVPAQQCSVTDLLCVQISSGLGASFSEKDTGNNVFCVNITAILVCQPGMFLSTIQPIHLITYLIIHLTEIVIKKIHSFDYRN